MVKAMLVATFALCQARTLQAVTLEDFGYQHMKGTNGALALGSRPLLVILVNFPTRPQLTNPPSYFSNLIFNAATTPSFNGYFQAVSNGRFLFSNAGVIGPLSLTASETETNYVTDRLYCSNIVYKAMVSGLVNFGAFDVNHDGHVTQDELSILVISQDTLWGWRPVGSVQPSGLAYDWQGGVSVLSSPAQPDINGTRPPFATMVEETEESLGTPDIYGPERLSQGLTPQSYNCCPTNLYYLDPWDRMELGWCEPRIRSMTRGGIDGIPAAQSGISTAPILLYEPAHGTNEYFLLEYRTPTSPYGSGYDANVGGTGLAVWHMQLDTNHNALSVLNVAGTTNNDVAVWNEGPPNFTRGSTVLWGSGATTPPLVWANGQTTATRLHVGPFNPGDGTITVQYLTAGDTWVDFINGGGNSADGSFAFPYNSVAGGLANVPYGGIINFKTGSSSEHPVFSFPVKLKAYNGPVIIGR